jgi:serine/threonine protein kinase
VPPQRTRRPAPRVRTRYDASLVRLAPKKSSIQTGAIIAGRYRLDDLIGQGGMGKVFRATDVPSQQVVAMKIIRPEFCRDATTVERFRREITLLAQINHPGIVHVLDCGMGPEGSVFLTMELLEGETLLDLFRRAAPLDARDFAPLVDDLAGALHAVHERGAQHRDLKPSNVFLPARPPPYAKLIDFGVATATDFEKLTLTGQVLGTPRYMSPERIAGRHADHRSDIYAVGVILYGGLAGRPPFAGDGLVEISMQVMSGNIEPLAQARPDLPRALCDVVHRAMAREPNDRFNDVRELAYAFRSAATGAPHHVAGEHPRPSAQPALAVAARQAGGPPAPPIPVGGPAPPPPRSTADRNRVIRRWLLVVLGLAVVMLFFLVAGVVIAVLLRDKLPL